MRPQLEQAVIDASVKYFNSDTKKNHSRWGHAVKCFIRGIEEPYVKQKTEIHKQLENELGGGK